MVSCSSVLGRAEERLAVWKDMWIAVAQGTSLQVINTRYRKCTPRSELGKTIKQFSAQSRRRLMRTLATTDWTRVGKSAFITVTYPDTHMTLKSETRNRERFRLHREIESIAGKRVPACWRVEWKRRLSGACLGLVRPHIHFILYGFPLLDEETLRKVWSGIIGNPTWVEVDSETVESGDVVGYYVSKYCAKDEEEGILDNLPYLNKRGRHYGYLRKNEMPFHECHTYRLSSMAVVDYLKSRACDVIPGYDRVLSENFTLLGDVAAELISYLKENAIDKIPENG